MPNLNIRRARQALRRNRTAYVILVAALLALAVYIFHSDNYLLGAVFLAITLLVAIFGRAEIESQAQVADELEQTERMLKQRSDHEHDQEGE